MTVFFWSGFNVEIDPVIGLVSVAFLNQIRCNANHVVDVLGAPRVLVSPENVQRIHVFVVRLNVLVDQRFPIPVKFIGAMNDFVIDIGEILYVLHVVAAGFQPTMYQIEGQITARMAQVTSVVDGYTADVHGDLSRFQRGEVHLLATTGIMHANGHGLNCA